MESRRILFRADANEIIGLGHVIRTLALISCLDHEFHCVFVIKRPSPTVFNIVKTGCNDVVNINNEPEFFSIIDNNDIVVLDGYNYDQSYQFKVKKSCLKLVCIDDIADREFSCDAIINHSEGVNEYDYSCNPQARIYLGLKYALLRKPFLLASAVSKRAIDEINTFFVCFGGSDNENFTRNTVEQLIGITDVKKMNVVVGGEYLHIDDLKLFCESINSCEILIYSNVNAEEMVNIMLDSHIAIVPSSSISYEALSVKIPVILGYTVANQKLIYNSLTEKKLVLGIEAFPINNMSEIINEVRNMKNCMLENQSEIFDGNSSERLLKIFNDLCNE